MTVDILICSFNKGIVRIGDILLPQDERIHYILSYQYTDERYLDLIPKEVVERDDVSVYSYKGKGLSANRNHAIEKSTHDLMFFADDDSHFTSDVIDEVMSIFDENKDLDIAFFKASTYTGKLLKNYPTKLCNIDQEPKKYSVSAIEMVCRRASVQHVMRFDERFGLGTSFLTCGEDEIWLLEALKRKMTIYYFPLVLVETSTLLKKSMLYVDPGVQRSFGAISYYKHGNKAFIKCFYFAINATKKGYCHFIPFLKNLYDGIRYMKK